MQVITSIEWVFNLAKDYAHNVPDGRPMNALLYQAPGVHQWCRLKVNSRRRPSAHTDAQRMLLDGGHNFTLFLVVSLSWPIGKHFFDGFYHVRADLWLISLSRSICSTGTRRIMSWAWDGWLALCKSLLHNQRLDGRVLPRSLKVR